MRANLIAASRTCDTSPLCAVSFKLSPNNRAAASRLREISSDVPDNVGMSAPMVPNGKAMAMTILQCTDQEEILEYLLDSVRELKNISARKRL